MQDRFSKWVEMRPLRRATTPNILREVTEAISLRHECLGEILSDNDTQLRSAKLTDALRDMGIRHKFTPVYAPQCNPVERANRVIKTMISQYVQRRHRTWDAHITELQFAINTVVYEATGY